MNLVLFDITSELARQHFEKTVQLGTTISEIAKFEPTTKTFSGKMLGDRVRVWGLEPTQKNNNGWNRLNGGDLALFFDGKKFRSMARIFGKTRNESLGRALWGSGENGKTWELICFVEKPTEVNIETSSFAAGFGYNSAFKPLGFMIVDANRVDDFLAKSPDDDLASAILRRTSLAKPSLRDLQLKLEYRTGQDDLVNDFYIPCLEKCVGYHRAAGYFSAQVLNLAARGVAGLIRNEGSMRLVVDPLLSSQDVEQIKKGYSERLDEVLVRNLKDTLANADEETLKRVEATAWLVATGKLEIKVAIVTGEQNIPLNYPYHEKWGIFVDSAGDKVVFTGSMNETPQGLEKNFESIDVYASWKGEDPKERVRTKEQDFEKLWQDKTPGLRIFDFPEAAKKELLKHRPAKAPTEDPGYIEPRCPACLELVDRPTIQRGVPICLSCKAFLPLALVGFSHYMIEGSRVQVRVGDRLSNGRVLAADYSKPLFTVRLDTGQSLDAEGEIQRVAFKSGQKVLANGKPAVVMSHSVGQKDGRLTYTVLLEEQERIIPELGVEPAPPSVEEEIRTHAFEDPQRWSLYILASIIHSAPFMANGEALLTASSKVKPYPHQLTIAGRIVNTVPPRFLLSDEVGLGKTIEVGLAIKELQLRGLLDRVLIVAPKLLVNQWIGELERRFNVFCKEITSAEFSEASRRGRNPFDQLDVAITSYQFIQREQRRQVLFDAEPWNIVIIDEAHHIRRDPIRGEKNELFKLVDGSDENEGLREKSDGLLLVTATPLQLRIQELFDLLSILGLGGKWAIRQYFERFFENVIVRNSAILPYRIDMARDFLSWGEYDRQLIQKEIVKTGSYATAIEEIMFSGRQPSAEELKNRGFVEELHKILDHSTPLRWSMFRNTREVLERYGLRIPKRVPKDHLFPLGKPDEAEIYNELSDYIRDYYEKSRRENRKALGFVMATYRKRLTSSFYAIKKSLEKRLDYLTQVRSGKATSLLGELTLPEEQEDEDDAYTEDDRQQAYLEHREFSQDVEEEIGHVRKLLEHVQSLRSDTKLTILRDQLETLFRRGTDKIIIFTQYYDTLEYLRDSLSDSYHDKIVCYSGKGGEISDDSQWKRVPTDDAVRVFQQRASMMISTEAGSEGKNFQFCNVIINFDLPWNPMRVEQRIGRVDRIGQTRDVEIHNMFFEKTIDGEVYSRLRKRIRLFETVVGPLHPILEKIEKYALEYPPEEALEKITREMEQIDGEHTKALEVEKRAQEFLFSGFDKAILERFGVRAPIQSADIRRFVELACRSLGAEMQLQSADVDGLYTLALGNDTLKEIQRRGGYSIQKDNFVIFDPNVAEGLTTVDPRFQESRLVAHGSPILDFLVHKWKQDPDSKVTGIRTIGSVQPSLLLLYKAGFSGLLHKEEIIPISVDLKSFEAKQLALESILQYTATKPIGHESPVNESKDQGPVADMDVKFEDAIQASRELWRNLFNSLNDDWTRNNEIEFERRRKLFESSQMRGFSKARTAIEDQARRLIALRYIQEYPNVERLPDSRIDVSSIAGPIEYSHDFADIFSDVQLHPSDFTIRGDEIKKVARPFRSPKQRQALHLQTRNAGETIRSEYSHYRKMRERIGSRIRELETQRGSQATYSMLGAAILSPG